ncbi:hypothetical protein RF11_11866 [Thelohanellus kitauei]|uniref:Uncharacterized protein n=1 Tax=Thelohanellus kitauei TaxID=669202 RepID=A0A0C2NEC9_THEKT|nr:hypothetical protein RF11_11865 [Thelohanellus kitauei]KII74666.1 hypothetical protein RF11_11866 [Thelohanellus kitauei]
MSQIFTTKSNTILSVENIPAEFIDYLLETSVNYPWERKSDDKYFYIKFISSNFSVETEEKSTVNPAYEDIIDLGLFLINPVITNRLNKHDPLFETFVRIRYYFKGINFKITFKFVR